MFFFFLFFNSKKKTKQAGEGGDADHRASCFVFFFLISLKIFSISYDKKKRDDLKCLQYLINKKANKLSRNIFFIFFFSVFWFINESKNNNQNLLMMKKNNKPTNKKNRKKNIPPKEKPKTYLYNYDDSFKTWTWNIFLSKIHFTIKLKNLVFCVASCFACYFDSVFFFWIFNSKKKKKKKKA